MYWKKTNEIKPCNRVVVHGSKVFDCTPEWEVENVCYNEMSPDGLTVRFKRRGEQMGKKYVIELEDKVSENTKGEKLYFVKGFNNLSLDETALKKLTPYEEHEFRVGDVVEYKSDYERAKYGIITKLTPDSVSILLADGGVRNPSWHYRDDTYTIKFIKSIPNDLQGFMSLITR